MEKYENLQKERKKRLDGLVLEVDKLKKEKELSKTQAMENISLKEQVFQLKAAENRLKTDLDEAEALLNTTDQAR